MFTPPPVESIAMDVDGPISPTASDASSSTQSSYTDDYASLPSNGPTYHAHIVDLGGYSEVSRENSTIMLQDAAVTTLYSISPGILETFLSPTVNTFKAILGKKDVQLAIWRKGLEVFVGTFENHKSMKAFRFEHLAGFLIGYDGSWHLKVTASNAYCTSKWSEVWAGKFEDHGGVTKMTVEVEAKDMEKRASVMAEYMLETKFWELKADIRST